jgi:hypothetical protein
MREFYVPREFAVPAWRASLPYVMNGRSDNSIYFTVVWKSLAPALLRDAAQAKGRLVSRPLEFASLKIKSEDQAWEIKPGNRA